MKKTLISLSILSFATSIFANDVASYAKCVACHGSNGEKVALGKSKIIKDMTKQELIDAMTGYQNGTYGGQLKSLMMGQVKSLSTADIQAIANKIGK